jgi:hypothetical protein
MFEVLLALAAMAGGLVASIAGFGVGSILTPLLAMKLGMKVAVAAVAIPHVVATAVRFWALRKQLDRRVFWTFGVTSAVGGLIGAVLHIWVASRALSVLLAVLLMFTGLTGLLGITLKFGRKTAWAAGGLSGMLGGLVGNQGGIRAGAMLGFDVPKEAFVATPATTGPSPATHYARASTHRHSRAFTQAAADPDWSWATQACRRTRFGGFMGIGGGRVTESAEIHCAVIRVIPRPCQTDPVQKEHISAIPRNRERGRHAIRFIPKCD